MEITLGLPEKIYSLKPAKTSDFTYSNKLNKLDEPKNIVEIIECIVQKLKKYLKSQIKIIILYKQKEYLNKNGII